MLSCLRNCLYFRYVPFLQEIRQPAQEFESIMVSSIDAFANLAAVTVSPPSTVQPRSSATDAVDDRVPDANAPPREATRRRPRSLRTRRPSAASTKPSCPRRAIFAPFNNRGTTTEVPGERLGSASGSAPRSRTQRDLSLPPCAPRTTSPNCPAMLRSARRATAP